MSSYSDAEKKDPRNIETFKARVRVCPHPINQLELTDRALCPFGKPCRPNSRFLCACASRIPALVYRGGAEGTVCASAHICRRRLRPSMVNANAEHDVVAKDYAIKSAHAPSR